MKLEKLVAKAVGIGFIATSLAQYAYASVPDALQNGVDASKPTGAPTQLFGDGSIFQTVANVLIFLVGAIAVIMLIIGGLRYVFSQGESAAVQGAKNTILYAIVGI